ncbi:MAG: VWA domain-containing protein [Phycisphaeraceae bacterium]|nr:VWA domain-containing protein [Phycisphaeraceae bacterium]
MTFATPILAGIAAAIAVPALIILYFLKLRRRDMEVSTTLLWKKAIQDLQANAPFQKLRNNILLFLQLLILAAALLALAQPEYRDQGLTNARHIIIIDNSASMNATDGRVLPPGAPPESTPTTRLDAAKQRALQLVDALKEPGVFDNQGEEAMVIVFNASAQVLQTFTPSKTDLRNAINSIQPTDAPGQLERAWALAEAYTGKKVFQEDKGFVPVGPGATVHLLSDGRLPDAMKVQRGETDAVFYHRVGTPDAPNVGITGVRAERAFDNPSRLSIFVGLQSTARQPRSVDVELIIDGATTNVRDVVVGAARPKDAAALDQDDNDGKEDSGDKWVPGLGGFVFPIDRAEGGIATVRISTREPDALPSDNIGYLVIPPAKRLAVALVSEGSLLIQSAFRGMKLSALDVIKPAQFQQMLDDGKAGQYDVFVLDRFLPQVKVAAVGAPADAAPGDAGAARTPGLPPGRSLVLGAVPPPPLGVVDEGPAEGAVFADFRRDHPALALSALDKITISKFRRVSVRPDTPVRVLASTDKGPGVLEVSDASVLSIVVPWDPGDSDWWLDPGWVLFMAGAVLYLSDSGAGASGDTVRPGDTLRTRVPLGSRDVRLTTPDNARHNLEPAGDGSVAFGPVLRNGIYTVSWQGPGTAADFVVDGRSRRPIAANLADPNESDIGAAARLDLANDRVSARSDEETALRRKIWPYLLLVALAIIMLEWWVYNRKVAI